MNSNNKKKKNAGELLKTLNSESLPELISYCGFYVIDKRSKGGALWVLHHRNFDRMQKILQDKGYKFVYVEEPRSTDKVPAWFCKVA